MRARVAKAVRSGRAGALFPAVATDGPGGTLHTSRFLHGAADAAYLTGLLEDALIDLLVELDQWCGRMRARHGSVVTAEVLNPFNPELFAPLVTTAFLSGRSGCTVARRELEALEAFLLRLERDSRSGWFTEPEFAMPVVGLRSHHAETHNGRQRVLRLDLAGGGRLAYKPRPANGEELFLAGPSSVFGVLNDLPPASGPIRLPTLRHRTGADPYSWQEWIEPPAEHAVIRRRDDHQLAGTRLQPGQAGPFWHRAGSLAAACFAFGVTDLSDGNLITGPGPDGPMYYPVDLEVYFTAGRRLGATGLISEPGSGHHHCGFENVPRWCAPEGPSAFFAQTADGLRLHRTERAWARTEARAVVLDDDGRAGYGPHLASFLRGMFDAWTMLCRHRQTVRSLLERPATTRVLLRPTADYGTVLDDEHLTGAELAFSQAELAQLRAGDVPYFYRSTAGGPLQYWNPDTQMALDTDATAPGLSSSARRCERLALSELGAALRDAVEFVLDDLTERRTVDDARGVRIAIGAADAGQVSFDWIDAGQRITYSWDRTTLRIRLRSLEELTAIRNRLLRLDHVDGHLRQRWADGDFTDADQEQRLRELTRAGATWLKQVIATHGWPGTTLVGVEAAAAASRLVQHLVDELAFQRDCLERLHAAAATGEVPWREVAYLTDTIRLNEGRPQVYATKFRKQDGRLVPEPVEDAEHVDDRRAAMGLQPLAEYARRLHEISAGSRS